MAIRMSVAIVSQDNGCVCVQDLPAYDRQGPADCSKRGEGSWNCQYAHCKLDLEENDGRSLPAHRSEVDTIDVLLEDLVRFSDFISHDESILDGIVELAALLEDPRIE